MIITLTPNTGIDYTLQLSEFQLNSTIRATGSAWGMGGKATDVSWILGRLGVPTRALGFAAGANGLRMEEMLRERGVETDFVRADGETRLNTVVVVPGQGQSTITSSTLRVSPGHLAEFLPRYQKALEGASCVVMGGSLPPGVPLEFYAQAIAQAHGAGVPVIFDSSGPSLRAGLEGRPDVLKPNLAELEELLGDKPSSQEEVRQAASRLHEEYGANVIVTMGAQGAVAVFDDGKYFVHPVSVPVVSAAGAGDGVLAGMALAYERGESLLAGLQHGFALAGAVLQTLATADFQVEEYRELLSLIRVETL
jgi:1-phosphofructokinase family hexose kinase